MNFTISQGATYTAQKVLIYGVSGIGKTSLASKFPGAVFIDTEDSTKQFNVRRLTLPNGSTRPTSWTTLLDMVSAVRDGAVAGVRTLVVDSLDWAESLCISDVCAQHNKKSLGEFAYGNGPIYVATEFGKLLNLFGEIIARNIHVVCTAHAELKRRELPEETGAYDFWTLKLTKKTAALVMEFMDMVLFCDYKTMVTKGANPMEKNKATGGKRMMHTAHTPWWDAKNRHGLPEELPLAFEGIAYLFNEAVTEKPTTVPSPETAAPALSHGNTAQSTREAPSVTAGLPAVEKPASASESQQIASSAFTELSPDEGDDLPFKDEEPAPDAPPGNGLPPCIPKSLADLMAAEQMTTADLQAVIYRAKCYPADTPIENMDPEFFDYLVTIWPQVRKMHNDMKGEKQNG